MTASECPNGCCQVKPQGKLSDPEVVEERRRKLMLAREKAKREMA